MFSLARSRHGKLKQSPWRLPSARAMLCCVAFFLSHPPYSSPKTFLAFHLNSAVPTTPRPLVSSPMQRMVAVASKTLRHASASPSLSFWRHARGSDPFGSSNGYTGSYTGARSTRGGISGGGGGTSGHWAPDTTVENPHGPGNAVRYPLPEQYV